MSNDGDRADVFRSTKVRTKLMGDNWWMQRSKNPEPEPPQAQEEEKPWIAEMRASRLNAPPVESSPVASPTDPTPVKPVAERAPPSGYLIRGVFTNTESKPAATSTTNGFSGSRRSGSFSKRPSDTYKKIAPHNVQTAPETTQVETEGQLSPEEQERRREAASNVLNTSSVRKRSYVLSAAKKYENTEKPPDTSEVTGSPAFVAKRVEITDDDDEPFVTPLSPGSPGSPASPVPSLAALLSPISPVPSSPAAVPEPTEQTTVEANVETMEDEPVALAVADVVPEPVKEEVVPPVPSLTEDPTVATTTAEIEEDPFAHMKPGCIKVFIPLPELPPECVLVEKEEEARKDPRPVDSDDSGREDTPPLSPVQASNVLECSVPEENAVKTDPRPDVSPKHSAGESLDALSETLISFDTGSTSLLDTRDENDPCDSVIPAPDSFKDAETVLEDDKTEQVDTPSDHSIDPEPAPEVSLYSIDPEPAPEVSLYSIDPEPAPEVSLYSIDPEPAPEVSLYSIDPEPAPEVSLYSIDPEPAPEVSNCIVMTDDLLSLTDGPEESSAEPVPSSPRRWGHDLLGPTDSDSDQVKTSSSLDLLADDVIPINTERHSLSSEQSFNDDTSDNTTAHTEDTTPPRPDDATPCMDYTTLHTDDTAPHTDDTAPHKDDTAPHTDDTAKDTQSLADPFDPYPIGRTSPNSSADLTPHTPRDEEEEEHPSPQIMSMSGIDDALDSLAEDVIPIDTDTERLNSERSWSRTWETGVPEHTTATVEESPAPSAPAGHVEEQRTVVTFEIKSSESDSPWDRWTSPTVYAVAPSSQEEEEEGDEDEQEPEGEEKKISSESDSPWDRWTSPTVYAVAPSSQEEEEEGDEDEQEPEGEEKKISSESDSPWDRWTSPTVYAVAPSSQEEEEEGDEDEQEPEGEERETHHSDLEPVMDRYQTYSSATDVEETPRVETPEPESKKGCVFVKEYVDAGELSLHNARDQDGSGSEYLTSSSSSSSYSRPNYSRVSESSTCTYCGEQVGNDAKITIEHLNISCHPDCFQCGVCSRPMGDLLYNMFLHGGKVHCESCYSKVFD